VSPNFKPYTNRNQNLELHIKQTLPVIKKMDIIYKTTGEENMLGFIC
jgi:hypothetical protein